MTKNKIAKRKIAIILSLLALSINSYGQNWADSIFYSSIRPNEKLQLHTLYIDTLEYINYDDNYDDFLILVKKDDETFGALICNDIHQIVSDLNLNRGDIVEIQWVIDSLRPEGDKELLWFREYALEITKIKEGEKEATLFTEEIETEEATTPKSFKVSYQSGHTTKYTLRKIGLEVDEPIICVDFWAERYMNGEWKFATSDYYYLYYKENKIQKIEDPGLSDNLLEINPHEWVTAFKKFAEELPSMLDEQTEDIEKIRELLWDSGIEIAVGVETDRESEVIAIEEVNIIQERRKHWKTGEFLDEMERKKIIIPLLNDKLEIREGGEFPCIVHELRGNSSYFEIKRRDGKYLIWGEEYNTINQGIEDYLKNDLLKGFYTNKEQREQVWESFVRDGSLQKAIDFINEIIDDEFLDSPLNEIYG